MTDKAILCVCMSHGDPICLFAGYKDGFLIVHSIKKLPINMRRLKDTLPDILRKHQEAGWVVAIDEPLPVFSKYGIPLSLESIGSDERPVIVRALEIQRYLSRLSAIRYTKEIGCIDISDSLIDEMRDGNGNITYKVNWQEVQPESLALLMAAYIAVTDTLFDKPSVTALFDAINGGVNPVSNRKSMLNRFKGMMGRIEGFQ